MKNLIFIINFIFFWSVLNAQTYVYKHVYNVDKETEVKSKGSQDYKYITFIKDKTTCYFSDKNGIVIDSEYNVVDVVGGRPILEGVKVVFNYQEKKDKYFVYKGTISKKFFGETLYAQYRYLYVSFDFSRINLIKDDEEYFFTVYNSMAKAYQDGIKVAKTAMGTKASPIEVYEKSEKPTEQKENIPMQLY